MSKNICIYLNHCVLTGNSAPPCLPPSTTPPASALDHFTCIGNSKTDTTVKKTLVPTGPPAATALGIIAPLRQTAPPRCLRNNNHNQKSKRTSDVYVLAGIPCTPFVSSCHKQRSSAQACSVLSTSHVQALCGRSCDTAHMKSKQYMRRDCGLRRIWYVLKGSRMRCLRLLSLTVCEIASIIITHTTLGPGYDTANLWAVDITAESSQSILSSLPVFYGYRSTDRDVIQRTQNLPSANMG